MLKSSVINRRKLTISKAINLMLCSLILACAITPSVRSQTQTQNPADKFSPTQLEAKNPGPQTSVAADQYNRAVMLYGTKKYNEALVMFETGQIAPNQAANAAYYRALCYHQLGKLKEAAAAYRYVFSKYPQSTAAVNAIKTLAKLDPATAYALVKDVVPLTSPVDWTNLPDQVAVPFRKAPGTGWLMVKVELDGIPVMMVFDTGAAATSMSETFLSQNGVKLKRTKSHGRAIGAGGEVSTNVAIGDVRLGELHRTTQIMVQDDRGQPSQLPGLLGQNFFGDMPYSIDDSRGLIIFSRPSPALKVAGPGAASRAKQTQSIRYADNEVPFRRDGNNMVVVVKVNGRECEMYFDTGAAQVSFADRHLAMCGLNRPTSANSAMGGGVGGQREAFAFYIDSIKMANVEQKNVRAGVLLNANFDRPLLGQTFLSGLRYTIDPIRKCIRFE